MFENDFIMKIIKDLSKFLAKILLGKSSANYELPEDENDYTSDDLLYKQLLELLEQKKFNEAEDILYDNFNPHENSYKEIAIEFYTRLNEFTDEELEDGNFSREEIRDGLKEMAKKLGVTADF